MKVDCSANYRHLRSGSEVGAPAARTHGVTSGVTSVASSPQASAATAVTTAAAESGDRQYDFTSMTRAQMRNWVNDRIRSGQMSFDESGSFVVMTAKTPVGGGVEVPAEGDPERIDFIDRTRMGIEGALWRHDADAARRLQAALDTLLRHQTGVNARA